VTAESARRLVITPGDPAGIGPEVVLRALPELIGETGASLSLVGPERLWEAAAERLGLPSPLGEGIECVPIEESGRFNDELIEHLLFSGRVSTDSAALALAALETGEAVARSSPADTAIVTGPVHKGALHTLGFTEPGQTEWFAHRCGAEPLMMLIGGRLRAAVLTTHLPLREVAAALNRDLVRAKLTILDDALRRLFGLSEPRIALLALNPHGGQAAEEGEEEQLILRPAVEEARAAGIGAAGPFSADAFFGRRAWEKYDAVLAPYHDQGLIPVKIEAAGAGVNLTLGLPIIRTSPDHGTAFDIAGRGQADARATIAAGRLAAALLRGEGAV